ncbi:exported protein of unknown function [Sterolibacterium denitrificans]|uniref:Lipoprotein n=1 Tax=Sterolibacterium denitrificans TaxID=157592 RepID=A0A7Z7HSR1_9PROT|nr:hypothetical protein [Sterolibacterium denitrificans]SMB29032.1 exported protein of unknown function [Sterolibacterium denitrificans]
MKIWILFGIPILLSGCLSKAFAGNPPFVDKFMELTQHDPQFIEYQFESINQGSNMTRIRKQLDTVGQSFDALDTEHKEAIFSSSVQHGGGGANKAVQYAFSPKLYDEIETRYGLRLMEYQEAIAEGKKLQSQATTLESQAKTLESQKSNLLQQQVNLLQQQVNLLQQGQQAGTGQIQDLQRQINALDQKIEAQNAKVTANDKLIQETKAWLVKNAKDSIEDGERFIHDIYEWRIKNNPGEAKTRYIPERDMLLQQLRDKQQQNNKK